MVFSLIEKLQLQELVRPLLHVKTTKEVHCGET
jgi:hypothetical protein